MTVNANDTVERYANISSVGPYPFSFRIFAETDLQVTACSTATPPVPTLLTYLTHYTVTGANIQSGGSITLTAGTATTYAGYTLDIRSNTPQTQPISIRNIARFQPEVHEDAYDRLDRQVQDLNRRVLASVRYPDNVLNDGMMTPISAWLSKYLTIDSSGNLTPAVLSSTVVTSAIVTSLISGSTADQDAILALLMERTDTSPGLTSLKRTAVEIANGTFPVNYAYDPGNALRYGTNTTPGTTDMTSAIQTAITLSRLGGPAAYVPAGAYKITSSLVPGPAGSFSAAILRGDGPMTQIINACAAGNASFNGSGVSGWTVRDLQFTGNDTNPNIGILCDGAAGTTVDWTIESVTCCMSGIGTKLKDTNSGSLIKYKSWPPGGPWVITPSVADGNKDHHIYGTGGFVHQITIFHAHCLIQGSYKAGMCGFKCDATNSLGNIIIGGDWEGNDNTMYAFSTAGNHTNWSINAPYIERALTRFNGMSGMTFNSTTNGGTGGSLELVNGASKNTFNGLNVAVFTADSTSSQNTFNGCNFPSATDSAVPANRFNNCQLNGVNYSVDLGGRTRLRVNQSGGGTLTIDASKASIYEILVNDATAFTIGAPSNLKDAMPLDVMVYNNTGGAIGVITWNAVFHKTAFTNPASGNYRIIGFYGETSSNIWRQRYISPADIT